MDFQRFAMGTVTVETKNSPFSIRLLRLLLLEQDASEAAKILRELKDAGMELAPCVAANQAEFQHALSSGKFDAIVSAWKFAGAETQEALRMLRESNRETPLVLVTGESEERAAEDCIKCGAADYVSRDRLARLPFALKRAAGEHGSADEATRLR